MKQLLSILFVLTLSTMPCYAQFGGVPFDPNSAENKKLMEKMAESNPQLKKILELQGDTAAMRKFIE